jgi:hypothetical protein
MADGFDTDHSTLMARTANAALAGVSFAMSPAVDASRKRKGGFDARPPGVGKPANKNLRPSLLKPQQGQLPSLGGVLISQRLFPAQVVLHIGEVAVWPRQDHVGRRRHHT